MIDEPANQAANLKSLGATANWLKRLIQIYVYFERSLTSIPSSSLSRWETVGVRVKKSKIMAAQGITSAPAFRKAGLFLAIISDGGSVPENEIERNPLAVSTNHLLIPARQA
ncbi:MAG: hypothetical protein V2J65_13560 [Desulfobacteraceae bacterium]|jgi:hypothetical protein|nr:hypothetical protein [Desulfobacteraceae bacterium]